MAPRPPFDLVHRGRVVGTVVSYTYAAPVATGELVPAAEELLEHYRACWTLAEAVERLPSDLPDEDADAVIATLCDRFGITWHEHAETIDGWAAHFPDGEVWELTRHPAFAGKSQVAWRW